MENTPNEKTIAAIKELEDDSGKSFKTVEDLMDDLNDEDSDEETNATK